MAITVNKQGSSRDVINYLFDDPENKQKTLDLFYRLKPKKLYFHLRDSPDDLKILMLAKMLHANQKDKGGYDYMLHLMHAADIALTIKDSSKIENIDSSLLVQTLFLHDSLEDEEPKTNASLIGKSIDDLFLEYGVDNQVLEAITLMTRPSGVKYSDFIDNIVESNNSYANIGKVSDILSNNHPLRRLSNTSDSLTKRYNKALIKLGVEPLELASKKRKETVSNRP
jgi:hypothetical protein